MTSTPESLEPVESATVPLAEQPAPAAPAVVEPDERLLGARDLAVAALREITPEHTIGPAAGASVEPDGVVSLRFENRLGGYPGWYWTVSLARVEGEEPTVLEAELLPGDSALVAPEWVPWATRLSEYQAAQAAEAAEAAEAGEGDDLDDTLDDDELDDLDAADFDEDGSPLLHSGDVDGVDIDTLDPNAAFDDDADDDDTDDDDTDDDTEDDDDEFDADDDDR